MKNLSAKAISIPFDSIERIAIYNNPIKNGKRKTLSQIIKETGADYGINGTLYNMANGKPVCPLKFNDYCEFHSRYSYWAYMWNTYIPRSFTLDIVPGTASVLYNTDSDITRRFQNYIACSLVLMDGMRVQKPIYNSAQGGYRGRTAIGTKYVNGERRLCLYASKDKTVYKETPEKLAKRLQDYGWRDAIMLDCGSSSELYCKTEKQQVYNSRKCAHYILVYLKKGKT